MTREEAQQQADEWNAKYPIGTEFFTYDGPKVLIKTTEPASATESYGTWYPQVHKIALVSIIGAGAKFIKPEEQHQ